MNRRCGANRGFTIVEIMVVISIIAVLLGLLLPALSGVKKRSRKAQEINAIRQVGLAWNLYANANNGAALPGYLETAVQEHWKVGYEYPDGTTIPPAPNYTGDNIAGPWTWRLLPHLDNALVMLHGYRDLISHDLVQDWQNADLSDPYTQSIRLVAELVATEPAFGYNAYYVGGWWAMVDFNGTLIPRYRFYGATIPSFGTPGGSPRRVSVVVRSVAQIRRSSELVIFCSSAELPPMTALQYHKLQDNVPGSHLVIPPFLAEELQWKTAGAGPGPGSVPGGGISVAGSGDPSTLEVVVDTSAPIGRYTGNVAVLYADGHSNSQTPGTLVDQRKWINIADQGGFQHQK
ncbi:MAG: type II secretion system protein [Planctomycetes bacterium]|nr:type II secretion system protein [Planctomycetota bacterium]